MAGDGGGDVAAPEVMNSQLKVRVRRHKNSRLHHGNRGCRRYHPGLVITALLLMLSSAGADPLQVQGNQ